MAEYFLIDIREDDTEDEAVEALLAECLKKYEFDPSQPRDESGKWTDDGGGLAAHKSITDVISRKTETNPLKDVNQDGVTDSARVGVPGFEVPPPPPIPRLPNLTATEREVEDNFAVSFEADPDGMTGAYYQSVLAASVEHSTTPTFSTDEAKEISQDYAKDKDSKGFYNAAVHQTANAIAKNAFVDYLDVVAKLPDSQREVLVTAGGVAAGKGYALAHAGKDLSDFAAIYDTAGEQNSTELPWILQEAGRRGIRATYIYVDADPLAIYSRVVSRAQDKTGRMVDADLYADSYAIGARNFLSFATNNRGAANFKYISNRSETPKALDYFPADALVDRDEVYDAARTFINANRSTLNPAILHGATIGRRLWH